MKNKITEQQARERATWQYKAIAATRGNQSRLGCILIAMMGLSGDHGCPRIGTSAIITSDGYIMARFQTRDRVMHENAMICTVSDLIQNLRGLADHLKLNEKDREAMFAVARSWVQTDYRTTSPILPTLH